ncbi:ABC transporter permease [Prosthecomicrobium sp. N25]|uniref:ABC transporter permease n=1 Tax=Prosthecomicrobium sp. N25 TaxID=3129254 RepID=UPI00307804DD
MPHEPTAPTAAQDSVAIENMLSVKEKSLLDHLLSAQSFWVTVVFLSIFAFMSWLQPDSFPTANNLYNISRNFAFIGIMALGMTCVILTGGIDLSVGSIMGMVAVVCGLVLQAQYPWYAAVAAGLLAGGAVGVVNGFFVAYVGLSSFVVTLGAMSIARSLAIVLSGNKMIYDFGPSGPTFKLLGGGDNLGLPLPFPIANPVLILIVLTIVLALVLRMSAWGRHLYAIGGNEHAATLTGVNVKAVKLSAYVISALSASLASILIVGWQGSAINALGQSYELRVIASTVIGGADLMGGAGGAYGAFIGAALIELIRNSLLMAGVDSNWQGAFVGVIIILAVLLERVRGRKRA